MSHNLYSVRIQFDAGGGCIKAPGFYRSISKPPTIHGLPMLSMIDFTPEVNVADLRAHMGERREMTEGESLACVAWLKSVQAGKA